MKIIGLGCNCDVGFFIKYNFPGEYYPFDWIWSNIDFIIDTFDSDYFEFTECEKLNPIWSPPNEHTYIFNNNCNGGIDRICSALSVHDADNLSKEQYLSNITSINDKYKRRFKRLYDILNSNEEIILIRKVLDKNQGAIKKSFESDEKINKLSNILSEKFNSNITICVIDDQNFLNANNLNKNIILFKSFDELFYHIKKT